MRFLALTLAALILVSCIQQARSESELPFKQRVEVYHSEEGGELSFVLRLEQPFLAGEFEESSFLRLRSEDERAFLIYPRETRFRQKHAEFHGRLRGQGVVELTLSYETVSERLDGSRQVTVHEGRVELTIPSGPVGPRSIFQDWARRQNDSFAEALAYYPHETFFQYCLLQSRERYGVEPPRWSSSSPVQERVEESLYELFTGSQAIHEALQCATLGGELASEDLDTQVSSLRAPGLRSLPYEKLLEERARIDGVLPRPEPIARLVPADQYLVSFGSLEAFDEVLDLSARWGDGLLRLFRVRAQEHRLLPKLEQQLCLRIDPLMRLFAQGVVEQVAVTGADPFALEGSDLTVILLLEQPQEFEQACEAWLDEARQQRPDLVERAFNYRGHEIVARYTTDRVVSSFLVRHDEYFVISSSHRAIRRLVDVAVGEQPSLFESLDYRYMTTILPPAETAKSGYLFASEAFIERLVGPEFKISQKRRKQCASNLLTLNDAALFYRLENARSPRTLGELVEGRYVDPRRIVCPHGGSYAIDAAGDTSTCSLHNRLKYLTPNAELSVEMVSGVEVAEYEQYRQRYSQFWQEVFDPIAVRIQTGPRLRLETCVLPFANSSRYREWRAAFGGAPRSLDLARTAPSAVVSLVGVPGRERIGGFVRELPGMAEVLRSDPALFDLQWLGDRAELHFCDGDTIVEVDPTRLRSLDLPLIGRQSVRSQAAVAALVVGTDLPLYVACEVEDKAKAARLLELATQQVFLQRSTIGGVTTGLDGYRLPDHRGHAVYVFSARLYALKLRLFTALVGERIVAATQPELLHEVIDRSLKVSAPGSQEPSGSAPEGHLTLRWNHRAIDDLFDEAQLYWAERSRLACHRNIPSVRNLHTLYGVQPAEVAELSQAKYGFAPRCPDGGRYELDGAHGALECNVHGSRSRSRQRPLLDSEASFARFLSSLDEIVATLRFEQPGLIATVEIVRAARGE